MFYDLNDHFVLSYTAPPVITLIGDTTRTVTSPEDVIISVTIGSSNLPVTVQWSYNNQPLTTNSDYTITTILSSDNTTGNSSLTVHSTNTGDDGNHIVNVSNIAGNDMTTVSVVIHGEWSSSVCCNTYGLKLLCYYLKFRSHSYLRMFILYNHYYGSQLVEQLSKKMFTL